MPPRRSTRSSLGNRVQSEATTPTTNRSFSKPNSNTEDSNRSSPASSVSQAADHALKKSTTMEYSNSEDELDTLDKSSSKLSGNHGQNERVSDSLSPTNPETELSHQSLPSRSTSQATGETGPEGGFTIEISPPKPKRTRASDAKPAQPSKRPPAQARTSKHRFDLSDAFGDGNINGRSRDDGDQVDEEDFGDQLANGKANDSESSLSDLDFLSGKTPKTSAAKKVVPMSSRSQSAAARKASVKKEEENQAEVSKATIKKRALPTTTKRQPRGSVGSGTANGKGKGKGVKIEESEEDEVKDDEQDSTSETEEALLQHATSASLGGSARRKQASTSNLSSKKDSNVTRSGRTLKAPTDPRGVKRSRGEVAGGNESNWDDNSSEEDEDFGFTSSDDESHFDDELPDEGVSEDENIFKESRASASKNKKKSRGKSASTSPVKGRGRTSKSMQYDEADEALTEEDESKEQIKEPVTGEGSDDDDKPLINRRFKAKSRSASSASDAFTSDTESALSEEEESDDDVVLPVKSRKKALKSTGGGFIKDDEDSEEDEEPSEAGPSNWQQLQQQAANSTQSGFPGDGTALGGAGAAGGDAHEEQRYETAIQRTKRLRREAREASRLARHGRKRLKKRSQYEKTRAALNKNHPELEHVWKDLKEMGAVMPDPLPQPEGLTVKLLPFQREGLGWLVRQEQSHWSGGMLADEMGMGKTIQMISLFLSDRKKPALVVAPTVAIMQWRNEIEKYTKGFKVEMFHGANRSSSATELAKKDVVLTSYAVLESCFRKQEAGFKRKGQLIKEKSVLHSIDWHRIVLDEAHNIKERSTNTAKGAFELKGTYRWCLSGTPLQNRVGELYSMIRFLGGDPFAYYYCKQCPCKSLHWSFPDRRTCAQCGHSPMQHVCYWNNEILKPIQKEGMQYGEGKDAYGRLRLLLERMMLRRTKLERADDMGLPPRTVEVRRDLFNDEEEDLYKSLYVEGTRKFSTYIDSGTILNNYSNIFTLLTRMRQMANHPDLVLRSKTGTAQGLLGDPSQQGNIMVCRICNEEAEDAIMSKCRHVFCRECVRQYLGETEGEIGAGPDCPHCHAVLSIDLEAEALESPDANVNENPRQGIIGRLDMEKWRSSTKIEALVEELSALKAEDHTIKSLVFSQFVNFLDLVAFRLQKAGFQICRLEGSMSPEARNRTINHFMNNPGITVFLLSLKAGGVALNLTEASRVFILDPWWNPSVEVQAMDRVHRIGQHRPVVVKRMIIENSIESRIIELQVKKSAMIEAAIGKDDAAMGRLTVADLRFLFTL